VGFFFEKTKVFFFFFTGLLKKKKSEKKNTHPTEKQGVKIAEGKRGGGGLGV